MSEHYSGGGDKTVAKLVVLRQYIWAYEKIMESKLGWKDRWYIGTHAGTGKTHLEKSDVHVDGSVLRALDFNFDRYYLYKKDPNHFETLRKSIESETGADLMKGEIDTGDDIYRGSTDESEIYVMNMDCNDGVEFLVNESRPDPHWFVFVDPEGNSFEGRLLHDLMDRGNADILYNFQSTGIRRNASEDAEHSHESITKVFDIDDWPTDGDEDDYVELFKEEVFEENNFNPVSKKLISTGDKTWGYDLIFGSEAPVAKKVMNDIMSRNPEQKVREEVQSARERSDVSQEGLEEFGVRFTDHDDQTNLDSWI